MRVYTCTPVPFRGDASFFARESGLFARSLQSLGIESRAVLPKPAQPGDLPDLLRADPQDLRSADWWRSLGLHGLILYSWAAPRYNAVVQAAAAAGIPVCVNMDTSGLVSPLAHRPGWLRESLLRWWHEPQSLLRRALTPARLLIELAAAPTARRRLAHYEAARRISVVSPGALEWILHEVHALGRPDLADRFFYLPHPQLPIFTHDGGPKEPTVLSVGRWTPPDWGQKNPALLLAALQEFLRGHPAWNAVIVGAGASALPDRFAVDSGLRGHRIRFVEHLPPTELPGLYNRARIGFWTSRWEGQQGTAAQALCCGCTVVSLDSDPNVCFRHYVSDGGGRLAPRATPGDLAAALAAEAAAWDAGQRDPAALSRRWTPELHGPSVARRALHALGLTPPAAG